MVIGSTVGHYRIVEKLGEGGMGVVYRAEDTKLERSVALKFLADHLLENVEAKRRFLREAKAAASLHHPNVCPVYEIGECDTQTFLVMALLKGDTLEQWTRGGPAAISDVLEIGRQLAEGLGAAHAEGIVHRDIKPANVIVSPEGRPSIMDFGLARLMEASRLTAEGKTLGTAAYMSPEQAQGQEVDHRSDLWSLGCVLYEMVAGQRPFLGQYDQAIFYEIVNEEPIGLTSVRTGVPLELEFIVSKCMAKNPEDRYQHANDVARDLRALREKLQSGKSLIASPTSVDVASKDRSDEGYISVRRHRLVALQLLAAALGATLIITLAFRQGEAPPQESVRRFSLAPAGLRAASISPDGLKIAYATQSEAESKLWLRTLDSETRRRIPGTEGARPEVRGWSPDSRTLVFATATSVKRVNIDGGDPVTLCELPGSEARDFSGVSWSPDGERVVFSSQASLWEVPSRGGEPRVLLERGEQVGDALQDPYFLPAGDGPPALLYTAGSFSSTTNSRIWVLNLATGERSDVADGAAPIYTSEGRIIYQTAGQGEGGLQAMSFSIADLRADSEPYPVAGEGFGSSVSTDGVLLYLDLAGEEDAVKTLVWRDRKGTPLEKVGQPQQRLREFSLSPNGLWVAATAGPDGEADVWLQDLSRSATSRLTISDRGEYMPAWSPDGRRVVYTLEGGGGSKHRLMLRASDGSGEPSAIVEADSYLLNPDWSSDGRFLVYQEGWLEATSGPSGPDIRYVQLGADGVVSEPETFLESPAAEGAPKLSPDGRFLVYVSNESGRSEIYVRSFPGGEGRQQASVNGGTQPRWRSDGQELFYIEDRDRLMAVDVHHRRELALGTPRRLFESSDFVFRDEVWPQYDVSADGQRLLTATVGQGTDTISPTIRVVENWYREIHDRDQ